MCVGGERENKERGMEPLHFFVFKYVHVDFATNFFHADSNYRYSSRERFKCVRRDNMGEEDDKIDREIKRASPENEGDRARE